MLFCPRCGVKIVSDTDKVQEILCPECHVFISAFVVKVGEIQTQLLVIQMPENKWHTELQKKGINE